MWLPLWRLVAAVVASPKVWTGRILTALKPNIALRWPTDHQPLTLDPPMGWGWLGVGVRFGTRNQGKAIFAVAHTLIVIIWHLLAEGSTYDDLGVDYFERRNDADRRQCYLVNELEKLGHTVTLAPAA